MPAYSTLWSTEANGKTWNGKRIPGATLKINMGHFRNRVEFAVTFGSFIRYTKKGLVLRAK